MNAEIMIGDTKLDFEAKDIVDLMNLISPFSQGTRCGAYKPDGGVCNSRNVAIDHRVAKGKEENGTAGQSFDFYSIKCLDCGAEAQLGEYQNKSGFYLKNWARREQQQ